MVLLQIEGLCALLCYNPSCHDPERVFCAMMVLVDLRSGLEGHHIGYPCYGTNTIFLCDDGVCIRKKLKNQVAPKTTNNKVIIKRSKKTPYAPILHQRIFEISHVVFQGPELEHTKSLHNPIKLKRHRFGLNPQPLRVADWAGVQRPPYTTAP